MGNPGRNSVKIASGFLIVVGAVLLTLTIVLDDSINIALPLVFLMMGGVFYILVFAARQRWSWASVLFIPGSFLLALGVILLLNVLTGDRAAWAYAWLLLLAGLGLGVILAGRDQSWPPAVNLSGWGSVVLGVTLFAVFGAIAGGLFIKIMAPILIIMGGVLAYLLRIDTLIPEPILQKLHLISTVKPAETPLLPAANPINISDLLSARELEVLRLVDEGLSNQQIAYRLNVAPSTVKTHINNIYGKLDVKTRIQAVHQAHDLGLFEH